MCFVFTIYKFISFIVYNITLFLFMYLSGLLKGYKYLVG